MKKFLKLLGGILAAACLCGALAGCNTTPDQHVVTLDLQDGSEPQQVTVDRGLPIMKNSPFKTPEREGWFFDGWYLDKDGNETAMETRILDDITVYAVWTDSTVVPMNPDANSVSYDELFEVSITAAPTGSMNAVNLFVSVTPKGDFTGENSTDRFEIQVTLRWLSNEQFMGEYTNEVVAYAGAREIYLEKSNNYTLTNYKITASGTSVPDYVFTQNTRTVAVIDYIFDEPTLQYNHNN